MGGEGVRGGVVVVRISWKSSLKDFDTKFFPVIMWWGCCGSCLWRKPAELAHSFSFCSCVYFCLYGPSTCIWFHKFSRQLSSFSLCSSGLNSASSVLSTTYLFVLVSLSLDLCGWLCLKHQLTILLKSFWSFHIVCDTQTINIDFKDRK